jgi:hypothetical protein
MKELLSNVFSKQYRENFLIFASFCILLVLLTFIVTPLVPLAIACALVSLFTVPLGFLLFIIVLLRRLFNQNYRPLTEIRLIALMVGLPFVAWSTYFLTNELSLFVRTQIRYRAAEELIIELEQYKKKEGSYPLSTGRVPAGFASTANCYNHHIGYYSRGDTFRMYFGLSSYLFTYHNYSYCPDWSKVPKESQRGKAIERANWRVEIGVD